MLTQSSLSYALWFLTLVASSSGAQIPKPPRRDGSQRQIFTPELSANIENALRVGGVRGLAATAVFANDSSNPQFATYGNRTEDGDLVEKETLFFIGSCSKAFLTGAMGILIDDFASGKNTTALPAGVKALTWDTKVHDLIGNGAEWKLTDPFSTERANVRDLLSHVTGLPGHDLYYRNVDEIQDIINRQQFLKQNAELRETWQYNNAMYIVGSHIIATYAGKPFTEFVQERIFAPLNMTSAFYFLSRVPSQLDVSQSFSGSRRIEIWSRDDRLSELIAGAGGILTNVVDMSKWLATLLNGGVNPATNQTIITQNGFDEATTAHVVDSGKATIPDLSISGYGLGWDRFSYRGHEVVTHTGGVPGFLSVTAFFPNDGVAVYASLNNGQAVDILTTLTFDLFDSLLNLPPNTISTDASSGSFHSRRSENPARSTDTNTTLDLSAYTGTYSNAGYGNITFCAPDSTFGDCPQVLANFSTIIPNLNSTPSLYAGWDRFWTSQAMLVPNSGNQWNFSTFSIYPNGFGKDTTPFTDSIILTPFPAVFDTDGETVQGFGLFGGIIGAVLDSETDDSIAVKDRAEIYFVKQ